MHLKTFDYRTSCYVALYLGNDPPQFVRDSQSLDICMICLKTCVVCVLLLFNILLFYCAHYIEPPLLCHCVVLEEENKLHTFMIYIYIYIYIYIIYIYIYIHSHHPG